MSTFSSTPNPPSLSIDEVSNRVDWLVKTGNTARLACSDAVASSVTTLINTILQNLNQLPHEIIPHDDCESNSVHHFLKSLTGTHMMDALEMEDTVEALATLWKGKVFELSMLSRHVQDFSRVGQSIHFSDTDRAKALRATSTNIMDQAIAVSCLMEAVRALTDGEKDTLGADGPKWKEGSDLKLEIARTKLNAAWSTIDNFAKRLTAYREALGQIQATKSIHIEERNKAESAREVARTRLQEVATRTLSGFPKLRAEVSRIQKEVTAFGKKLYPQSFGSKEVQEITDKAMEESNFSSNYLGRRDIGFRDIRHCSRAVGWRLGKLDETLVAFASISKQDEDHLENREMPDAITVALSLESAVKLETWAAKLEEVIVENLTWYDISHTRPIDVPVTSVEETDQTSRQDPECSPYADVMDDFVGI